MIGARVIVAVSVFSELGLHVSGRLIDWSDDRAGGRVRLLTDVDGICSETHEDSCLSNNNKTKLFDDSRRAVRDSEEGNEVAEKVIVCVQGRSMCGAVPACANEMLRRNLAANGLSSAGWILRRS
jgi:hypothetical protein